MFDIGSRLQVQQNWEISVSHYVLFDLAIVAVKLRLLSTMYKVPKGV